MLATRCPRYAEEDVMAELDSVLSDFAATSGVVNSPIPGNDRIVPSLASLTPGQFAAFHEGLSKALGAAGIRANIPFNGLRNCPTWTDVAILIATNQG